MLDLPHPVPSPEAGAWSGLGSTAADAPDRTGLIVLGLLAAVVVVSLWRILLRLLVVAALALAFVGLLVVASPDTAPAVEPPPPSTEAPQNPPSGQRDAAPAVPDQRAQGGG